MKKHLERRLRVNNHEKIKVAVYMNVTVPQALALQAMFKYWNILSGMGGSRRVGFYADGDGNFHPDYEFVNLSTRKLPRLTDEMYQNAIVEGKDTGDYTFDFDPIAWMMFNEEEIQQREARAQEQCQPESQGKV